MGNFRCDNCREVKSDCERATLSLASRILFMVTQAVLAGTITWSSELCKQCVRQRYLLSGLVVLGVLVLIAFFM
jgi:hypothetical protein